MGAVALVLAVVALRGGSADERRGNPDCFRDGRRLLFLGDSITQDGRYIAIVEAAVRSVDPARQFEVINLGLGSETASGLSEPDHPFPRPCIHDRLEPALAAARPDVTFICYGMNDGIYYPLSDDRLAAYRDGMTRLVGRVAATGSRIVLLTPPLFDAASSGGTLLPEGRDEYGYKTPYQNYNEVLQAFGGWLKEFDHPAVDAVIDLNPRLVALAAEARSTQPDYRYGDGIHPGLDGHAVMARAVVAELGMDEAVLRAVDAFVAGASAGADSPARIRFESVMDRHRARSQAYREFVGHSRFSDEAVRGNEAVLEQRLAKAGGFPAAAVDEPAGASAGAGAP